MGQEASDVVCPCCGGKVTSSRLLIDLDANVVTLDGKMAHLKAQTAEFLHILNKKFPASVRYEAIESALYGQGDRPDRPRRVIYVQAYQARNVGKILGFRVEGTYSRGYRLLIGL